MPLRRYFLAILLAFLLVSGAAFQAVAGSWTTVKNARHGFEIAYPTAIFAPKSPTRTDEGGIFESKDGKAKLLVGAFANDAAASLEDYRRHILEQEYAGVEIDYAPTRARWFVLAGESNGTIFYQRVTFTCGGKLINSWAMLYPASERKRYGRILAAVARSFTPGEGRTGTCD